MTTTKTINGGTLTVIPKTEPYNEKQNYGAFAVIKSDGSVFAWGIGEEGGDISSVASQLDGTIPVTQIFSNGEHFAALRSDGSVVTWGGWSSGSDRSDHSKNAYKYLNGDIDVTQIYSTYAAFAAIRADGSVISWGTTGREYTGDYSGDYSTLWKLLEINTDEVLKQLDGSIPVTKIFTNDGESSFAALRSDGSVVTWGNKYEGGDSSAVKDSLNGDIDIINVYSNDSAFAALRSDGSVISWGTAAGYMEIVGATSIDSAAVASQLSSGVKQIYPIIDWSNGGAFIAIKADGSVFTWGAKDAADISSVVDQLNG
ncbi:MAG: hypothetical protein WCI06_10380, partial [Methylococcaceae bacterium]